MAEVTDQPPAHRDAIVVTYDPEADAAYISFAPTADGGVARTVSVDDEDWLVNLDLDDDGRFVGMEVLGRRRLPKELLAKAHGLGPAEDR